MTQQMLQIQRNPGCIRSKCAAIANLSRGCLTLLALAGGMALAVAVEVMKLTHRTAFSALPWLLERLLGLRQAMLPGLDVCPVR